MPSEPLFLWIIGTIVALVTAAVGHLHKRISEVEDKTLESFTDQIERFKTEITRQLDDLRLSRLQIAQTMATRDELDRQVNRLLEEMRRPYRDRVRQ